MRRLSRLCERHLDDMIEGMRYATKYAGSPEAFCEWASNVAWNAETYQTIGYYSGAIEALLLLADDAKVSIRTRARDRARAYVYTS